MDIDIDNISFFRYRKAGYSVLYNGSPGITIDLPITANGVGRMLDDQYYFTHSCDFTFPSRTPEIEEFYKKYDQIIEKCHKVLLNVIDEPYRDYKIVYIRDKCDPVIQFDASGIIVDPLFRPERRRFVDYVCDVESFTITGFTVISDCKRIYIKIVVDRVSNVKIVSDVVK